MRRIDIDDPEVDMTEGQLLLYRGEPFTGNVAEYLSGNLVSLDAYTDGIPNGLSQEWYEDGTPRSEGMVRNGLPRGEFKEWHRNGVLASRQVFDADGLTVREHCEWDEEGRPVRTWRLGEESGA
ncbi:hypothetical protein [Streptomyces sp. FZ201]|uniref:toxin-antitoxin system YwqK family antitoxin n=1 Tax=Streptomyces sp. FZ201 TaxID=3057122 RepID=UPI0021C2245A|nr:hypothetical protein [Streptomyces sp. FZ201]